MRPSTSALQVFISYCHADEAWKNRVVSQLRVLEQEKLLSVWDDHRISGGDHWLPEIERAMNSCSVALLLISSAFLDSQFILGTEVPGLLQRRKEGLRVIPVILKPCPWEEIAWLSSIQCRPKGGKALSGMSEHDADAALSALAKEILAILRGSSTSTLVLHDVSLLEFDVIRVFSNNLSPDDQPWDKGEDGEFRRKYHLAADPVFDISIRNISGGTLVFSRIGVRILQRLPGTGGTMGRHAEPVKVQGQFVVRCHERWKHAWNDVDEKCWTELDDPIEIKNDDSSFRFTLMLQDFCDTNNASSAEVRFYFENSKVTAESDAIWLSQ